MIGKAGIRFIALAFAATLAISCVCAPDEVENVVEDVRVSPFPPGTSLPASTATAAVATPASVPNPGTKTPVVIEATPAGSSSASSVPTETAPAATPQPVPTQVPPATEPAQQPVLSVTTTLPAPDPVAVSVPVTTTTSLPPREYAPAPATATMASTTTTSLPSVEFAQASPTTVTTIQTPPMSTTIRPSYPDPVLPDLSPQTSGEPRSSLSGTFYVLSPAGTESKATALPASPLPPGRAANVSGNTVSAPPQVSASVPQSQAQQQSLQTEPVAPEMGRTPPIVLPERPASPGNQRPEPVQIEMNLSPHAIQSGSGRRERPRRVHA